MSYAGDLDVRAAWELLQSDDRAVLIDCRTQAEWTWVGVPDLQPIGKQVVGLQWNLWPEGTANARFAEDLASLELEPDAPVLFLCRSGARSAAAAGAATAAGHTAAYNISDGFEGQLDAEGHRGVGGWRAAGLPWRQS